MLTTRPDMNQTARRPAGLKTYINTKKRRQRERGTEKHGHDKVQK